MTKLSLLETALLLGLYLCSQEATASSTQLRAFGMR